VEGTAAPLEALRAIGRLEPDGPWIGFDHTGDQYRFIVDSRGTLHAAPADADLLLALAIAHFTEACHGAPPDLEATQADLSALVRHLMQGATDPRQRALLAEAQDAIDDGLAGDAVANRLAVARGALNERVDPVELLLARAEELLRGT
jgi:hypothetical protein